MKTLPLTALVVGAFGALVLALVLGPSPVGPSELLHALAGGGDATTRSILLDVRLPRVLLAALVGAALSAAGAAFQAILRNPLADPYILGVSGGAALGAVLFTAYASADPLAAPLGRPLAAFAGAAATLYLLFRLSRLAGRTGTTELLLVGVVLNALDSAIILFLVTAGDPARFQGVLFFLAGSIASPPFTVVAAVGILIGLGLAALLVLSGRMNLFAFGEEVAGHLGVDVEKTLWTVVLAASLITAAAVAFTGVIGFVGLIVPHILRTALGPDHRTLIPAAAIGGAGFVVLADAGARVLLAPAELPVGVLTALAGGPFFLFLFLRRLRDR